MSVKIPRYKPGFGVTGAEARALASDFRDRIKSLASLALGLIVIGAFLDAILLAVEMQSETDDHSLHVVSLAMTLAMIVMAGISFVILRVRANQLQAEADLALELQSVRTAMEAATRNRSRYFANLSHEMRSPLNTIYGYAQLLEQEVDLPPREAAGVIRRCTEHMTSLVESLLDVSQIENGVLRIRMETTALPEFLHQIVSMMRPAAQAKGLEFRYEEVGRIPQFVRTDQQRLRQALINLLTNAIKFTEEGSILFRITYRSQIATFEIVDTGPGIDLHDQAAVFEPYTRIESDDLRPAASGLGLGLPITKAIVEILGGELGLSSAPGEGSTFRVAMMLSEVANTQVPVTQRRIEDYEGERRSILVVDDDPDQEHFLASFLVAYGFDVHTAFDGRSAIDTFAQAPCDLAIVDIRLPDMSGWEVAERLRAMADAPLFVVMASANAREFDKPEHDRPAHDLFFVKPYRLDNIAEAIGGLLGLTWRLESVGGLEFNARDAPDDAADEPEVCAARLREAIRIGHVRGIEAGIQGLAGALPPDSPLIDSLFLALDQFNLARMAQLLEEQ